MRKNGREEKREEKVFIINVTIVVISLSISFLQEVRAGAKKKGVWGRIIYIHVTSLSRESRDEER